MASRRKIRADQLGEAIDEILQEYCGDVEGNLRAIKKDIGRRGAAALRTESREKFETKSGKYAKGWTATEIEHPHYTSVVLHNKQYSMPHLLEHGHALVRGGRKYGDVKGRTHIALVEEKLITEFEREVVAKL